MALDAKKIRENYLKKLEAQRAAKLQPLAQSYDPQSGTSYSGLKQGYTKPPVNFTQNYDPITGTYTGMKSGYVAPNPAKTTGKAGSGTSGSGGTGAGSPPVKKTSTGGGGTTTPPVVPPAANPLIVNPLQAPQFGQYGQGEMPQMPTINPYSQSPEVQQAYQLYQSLMGQKPGEYQSQYQPQMDALFQQMQTRQPFQYDMNADMLYQQMKDLYVQNAQRSMMDTQGQAAALTGGFGSSFGQMAGQQAYDQQMTQLNNNLPALYDRKYGEYQDQGQNLLTQFGMAGDLENQAYGQYRDQVGDWFNQTDRAGDRFDTERGFDYGQYGDQRDLTMQQYGLGVENYWQGQEMDYKKTQADRDLFNTQRGNDRETAMALLANGKMPSADLLASAGLDANTATLLQSLYQVQNKTGSGGSTKKTTGSTIDPAKLVETYTSKGTARLDEALENAIRAGSVTAKDAATMRQTIITQVPYTNRNMETVPNPNLSKVLPKLKPIPQSTLEKLKSKLNK